MVFYIVLKTIKLCLAYVLPYSGKLKSVPNEKDVCNSQRGHPCVRDHLVIIVPDGLFRRDPGLLFLSVTGDPFSVAPFAPIPFRWFLFR
jgi:hypothetical protein